MEKFGIPGMTVAVTRGDEVVYTGAFGVRDLDTGEPMKPEYIFHMASVSKPFAATAVVQLVEQGKIDLDESPATYLPYFTLDDERSKDITIRQMLNHTSGMPDVIDYEWDKPQFDEGAAERYVRSLSSEKMIAAPGERFRYSNMAFDTLGDVIAKVSGQSFEDYVTDHILDPLGMTESSFLREEIAEGLRTSPHVWMLEPVVSEVYPYNRRHAPSSTLNSSVVEMTNWAIANLNRGELNGNRILAEESYELLWTPSADVGDEGQVGLSWFIGSHRGLETISHGGGDTGYRSYIVLVPERDLGVIIAANYDLTPMGELYKGVLDIVLGHEPEMPKRWIALAFAQAYFSDGLEPAKTRYRELESTAGDEYLFSSEQLVYLAYLLMQNDQADAALDALRFNVELYPEDLDTYDYLAGAYAEMGDTKSAIEIYRSVLELDPNNENARRMIGELGGS
jgi:CubicO group peptidase (beta-lactamase class C family)